nr:ORF2 [Epsilontorquevirus sp.]
MYCCYLLPQQTGEILLRHVPEMIGDRKETVWYETVKKTHCLFCSCGDPINHLLKIHTNWTREYDRWLTGGDGADAGVLDEEDGPEHTGDGDAADDDGHGSAMEDAALAEAADYAEEQERSDTVDSLEGGGLGF